MTLVPAVTAAVAATTTAGLTVADQVFVSIGAAILFGLIGLVPLLSDTPKPDPERAPPKWDVMESGLTNEPPAVAKEPMTIDGEMTEVREVPQLTSSGARLGPPPNG
ncbi:hypothetical protein KTE62_05130 [Burkholderia multivorans]|uniref:hypothetical protein n=1 Tax=Burkholderia multivorans TaxID=87883 RepID=UPI001C229F7A|nr:hypothetical protein [Burkholderia multivorans]MBU9441099.1 hypothetical protein [Burkholderia multivorans]